MKDISHIGIHATWCDCHECSPYVPADKHATQPVGRIEVALTCLIVLALVVWIAAR